MSKGCDLYCGGIGDLVTCPSCERFQFHMPCLQKLLHDLGKQGFDPSQEYNGNARIVEMQIMLLKFNKDSNFVDKLYHKPFKL